VPILDLKYMAVRHLDDTAIPFILNSWLKSHRWSDKDNPDYYRVAAPKIKTLLKTNRVMVAALAEEPDCFVGWVCGKRAKLHYVYVKSAFRRDGVAKALIEKVCGHYGTYTHKSRNIAFMRCIDEKGYEYVEERQRDTSCLAEKPNTRTWREDASQVEGGIIGADDDHVRTGRGSDRVDEDQGGGAVHPD